MEKQFDNLLVNNNQIDSIILELLVDLDTFSRLPSNLSIHLDRNNHFIITAQSIAHIFGAQTIANLYKLHSTEKLVKDLDDFSKKLINVLNNELLIIKYSSQPINESISIKRILILYREFKLAYNGLPDTNNGGMYGLLETFKRDPQLLNLMNVVVNMKKNVNFIKKSINDLNKQASDVTYCPEIDFTDADWEKAMQIVPLLNKEYAGFIKYYINYSSTLIFNQIKYNLYENWWDEIYQFDNNIQILLGSIPVIKSVYGYLERNDLVSLTNLNIKAVLSVTEIFENNSAGYVYSPVTPNDWRLAKIKHYQIPSSDYCSMHLETLQKGVEFIHWNIKNMRSVYVHCKAGKSRSFLIIIAYFVKYLDYTVENAIEFVKSKRIQAGFGANSKKMSVLKNFEAMIRSAKVSA